MAKRKPKKDKQSEPPTLVAYWDKLTEGEIMQINNAVIYHTGRCNPGILPFTSMATICESILRYAHMVANHKGVYYRLLNKLEPHKYISDHQILHSFVIKISARRLLQLVPIKKRHRTGRLQHPTSFKFKLPFDAKSWAKVTPSINNIFYQVECAPKHIMALRAWLELT